MFPRPSTAAARSSSDRLIPIGLPHRSRHSSHTRCRQELMLAPVPIQPKRSLSTSIRWTRQYLASELAAGTKKSTFPASELSNELFERPVYAKSDLVDDLNTALKARTPHSFNPHLGYPTPASPKGVHCTHTLIQWAPHLGKSGTRPIRA